MMFRCYYRRAGGHVHMRIFCGIREGALGKCGNLCMRVEEFEAWRAKPGAFVFIEEYA